MFNITWTTVDDVPLWMHMLQTTKLNVSGVFAPQNHLNTIIINNSEI